MSNSITVQFDDTRVQQAFADLIEAGNELRPLFQDIGLYLKPAHKKRWAQGIAPSGYAWPELTDKTWAKKKGIKALYEEDDLLRGAIYRTTADQLTFGLSDWKANLHHFGVNKRVTVPAHQRLMTQAFGKALKYPVYANVGSYSFQQNLPARELIGLSSDDTEEIEGLMMNHIIEALKG